jgi:undecaprenyl-diphosphatase
MATPGLMTVFTRARSVSSWLWTPERRWLLFFAAGFLALGSFVQLGSELLEDEELLSLDQQVLRAVANWRRPWLTIPVIDITALGSVTLVTLVTVLAAGALLHARDVRGALQLITTVTSTGCWTLLTKSWFARVRPDVVDKLIEVQSYSFPSGHSSGAAALYVTLAVVLGRHVRTVRGRTLLLSATSGLALAIGLSRVYLGVHYPSDVASGLAFGTGWALWLSAAFAWSYRHRRGRVTETP